MEFLNWLNLQNADRLAGYSMLFLLSLLIIVDGIKTIFMQFKKK